MRFAHLGKAVALLTVLIPAGVVAHADPLVLAVRADSALAQLSPELAAELFLGKRQSLPTGEVLTPVDLDQAELREQFYQGVAAMSAVRVKAYWSRLVYAGRKRPPRELSLAQARDAVLAAPGTIGYFPASQLPPGARIVLTLPEREL